MAKGYIQKDGEVIAALQKLDKRGANTRPAMQGVVSAIHARIMVGFRQGMSPYGDAWAPVKGRSGQPLRDTGILQRGITPSATDTEGTITAGGAASRYAPVHQFGATITAKNHPYLTFKVGDRWVRTKSVKIPARPFLPITPDGATQLPPAWAQDVESRVLAHYNAALGA